MMEKIISIINHLDKFDDIKFYSISIYLFGSSIWNSTPNDIDILILYPKNTVDIYKVLNLKNDISMFLEKNLKAKIDMTFLSYEEEKEINFVKNERAMKLVL